MVVGGTLFARAMYSEGFVTVMDPFQHVYGMRMSCALVVPLLVADVLYSCVIISSLSESLGQTSAFAICDDHRQKTWC